MDEDNFQKGEIIIYKAKEGPEIQVKLDNDSVWLDTRSIARLFNVNRPGIVKHIHAIYKTRELKENLTCSKMEQVAADGKIRKINLQCIFKIL